MHLGAELDIATIGVTHRPLVARGVWPSDQRGAMSPLRIGDSWWLLAATQPGVRPLAVHPGWRVDLATAAALVTGASQSRTPEPLQRARQFAPRARSQVD